jgi:predicted transcriptional regulator
MNYRGIDLGIYRGKLEIIADILMVASRKPKKTQIMYQANLSFRVLQKYLAELKGASLICFQDEGQCYALTAKGRQFLEEYKEYSKSNRHVEKVLKDANVKKANLERLFIQ